MARIANKRKDGDTVERVPTHKIMKKIELYESARTAALATHQERNAHEVNTSAVKAFEAGNHDVRDAEFWYATFKECRDKYQSLATQKSDSELADAAKK